jgi:2-hydroxy-3-keto-5-methylthiopentenyl-1-phosphate phosphatase
LKAAELADLVIARDLLLKKSKERSLPYKKFVSFYDVIRILKELQR